jgi:peptidoglycan hydrolase CwlO-like protein
MSVLDDMIVNAKSAADAVGKTASKLVDLSKLRISAADLNAEINKKFESLGCAVYEARKSGTNVDETIEKSMTEIDELKAQLAAVNAQLAAAHQKVLCSNCGHENDPDAVFCGKCGHKLDDDHPEKNGPTAE